MGLIIMCPAWLHNQPVNIERDSYEQAVRY